MGAAPEPEKESPVNYRIDYQKIIADRPMTLWALYSDAAAAAANFDDLRDAGIPVTLSARDDDGAPWKPQFVAHGGVAMADDYDADDNIDAFHRGYDMHRKGEACPRDPVEGAGWRERAREVRVQAVLPARPEGYYHAPLGTFE